MFKKITLLSALIALSLAATIELVPEYELENDNAVFLEPVEFDLPTVYRHKRQTNLKWEPINSEDGLNRIKILGLHNIDKGQSSLNIDAARILKESENKRHTIDANLQYQRNWNIPGPKENAQGGFRYTYRW